MSAFLYLVWRSGRNRFISALRRVRSPRYAFALMVGGVYVWAFLIRPSGPDTIAMFLGQPAQLVVTLLLVLTLMASWVFGADVTALAFTEAEVSFLFPAPLSRRALIGFKLTRAQFAVFVNVLIWVFILRRGGTSLPSPLRAIGIWAMFSTLNFHRLAAALVRTSWREHGAMAARRHRYSIAVFVLVGLTVTAGLIQGRAALGAARGNDGFFETLARILSSPPASIALYPFSLIVAPTFARTAAEWARAIVPALIVAAVHVWWLLRTDTAFEDAAIDASVERARRLAAMRSRRTIGAFAPPRGADTTLHLASEGHPALAIFWKNMLCLRRTAQAHVFVGPITMAVIVGAAASGTGADLAEMVALGAGMLVGMLLFFGGRLIRNDLRHDMQHLPLLKSLPIAPGHVVLAEVASSALPMAAIQLGLLELAYISAQLSRTMPFAIHLRASVLLVAPIVVLALNGAMLTIQNGTAVLFPAWIRLGAAVNTGVEALGQNLLATIATLVSLSIALIPAAVVAWGVAAMISPQPRDQVAIGLIAASIVLAAETYGAILLLGRSFAKAEPGIGF